MPDRLKAAEYLRDYSNFIADLGREVRSDTWWMTWLAAKGAFTSPANAALANVVLKSQNSNYRMHQAVMPGPAEAVKSTAKTLAKLSLQLRRVRQVLSPRLAAISNRDRSRPLYIIRTFAFTHSFRGDSFRDVYFDGLADFLREKGYDVLTVFEPIGCFEESLDAAAKTANLLPLFAFLKPLDLPASLKQLSGGLTVRFPRELRFRGTDVRRALHRQYVAELLSPSALHHANCYRATSRMALALAPNCVVMPFENHPWERMTTLALRRSAPSCKIIGYHHTSAAIAVTSMFPGHGEPAFAPFPDKVLTAGAPNAQTLREHGDFSGIPIEPSCALRFRYLENVSPLPRNTSARRLLVALDGTAEAYLTLEYVLKQAELLPSWRFVIREHPACTIADLEFIHQRHFDFARLPNVEVSKGQPIQDDLRNASVLLYNGSIVALEALAYGLPLVFYEKDELVSHDAIPDFSAFKWTVNREGKLADALERIVALPEGEFQRLAQAGRDYVRLFFKPVTPEAMEKFLP